LNDIQIRWGETPINPGSLQHTVEFLKLHVYPSLQYSVVEIVVFEANRE